MKTKLMTATAFSLLMAFGAATAQSTSDGASGSQNSGTGSVTQQPSQGTGGQQIDPGVTNSTTQSTTGDSTAQPDCDPSNTLTGQEQTAAPQQNTDGTTAQRPAC
ncbi:hypothetical protein [Rhizobium sp. RU36D]|uniref:hypothetical protein n=1 Tax=Rhizobium sp. RU36D TaxID=1907415 RepID=UPI0009D90896|nr:hypothetical protein [Rhizobium sp. RU36D]SMC44318.1 hypothetical protein SAMN05880593_101391 [Rhizobium sp. RU36D]